MIKSIITSFLVVLFSFIYGVLVARFLGAELRGVLGSIVVVGTLFSSFVQIGLGQSFVYHKRKFIKDDSAISLIVLSILIILFFSTFMGFIIYTSAEHIEHYKILIPFVVVNSIFLLLNDISLTESRMKTFNFVRLFVPISNFCIVSLCYFFYPLSVQNVFLINLTTIIIGIYFLSKFIYISEFKGRTVQPLTNLNGFFSYGFKIYGAVLTGLCINNFDKIFLLFKGGSLDFGIYIVAFSMSRIIGVIPQTISTVIFSKFSGKDGDELDAITRKAFSLTFIPLMLLVLFVGFLATNYFTYIFGVEYQTAVLPFILLSIESVISSSSWILAQRFVASGYPGLVFVRQLISLVPLICLLFYTPPYEITIVISAAMLAAAILRFISTIVLYPMIFKEKIPNIFPTKKDIEELLDLTTSFIKK